MTGHDQVFCLLGTTRAKSGKDGFVKVDKGLDKTLTAPNPTYIVLKISLYV